MQTIQIKSREELVEMSKKLLAETSGPVALDVETEPFSKGKLPWELDLYGIGIYTPSIHWFVWKEGIDIPTLQLIVDQKILLMHNAKFDLHVLSGLGIDVSQALFEDTLIMSWVLDENCSHRLKDLAVSILGKDKVVKFNDLGSRPKGETLFADDDAKGLLDWEKNMAEYCLDDCLYTYNLFEAFKESLAEQNLWATYSRIELQTVEIVRIMERVGMEVDSEYLTEMGKRIDIEIADKLKQIRDETGEENLNPGSPKQLGAYLFDKCGHKVSDAFITKTGAASTNSESLKHLAKSGSKVAKIVLEWRELSKISSTFVRGILEKSRDGVLHAGWNQCGTVTGRMSSSSPNLMQLPRRSDWMDIRHAFRARDGFTFVICDLSQAELRMLAYFSDCTPMIKAFQNKEDLHQMVADKVGCERQVAKMVSFGSIYGISYRGLAKILEIGENSAETLLNEYFAQFPEVRKFMDSCAAVVSKNGFINNICGNRRRFPEIFRIARDGDYGLQSRIFRQSGNYVIQSSVASLMKIAMKRVHESVRIRGGRILAQIHDELIVEVPESCAEECLALVQTIMETSISLGEVPMYSDGKISKRWVK
jgi:DNA polymerase I